MPSMYKEFDIGEAIVGTPYRVVGLIGQGGMGSVYEVEHRELGKRFVLKALLRELVSRNDLVQRLRNEWRALGRLEHPNIVSVTDAGVTETGVPFYVMERLHGITLGERLRGQGALDLAEACMVAAEILEGLSAAHAIGVVHRDVKPPNIFLTNSGTAKILDFGIAKVLGGNAAITARGYAIGTPRYMSPEQAAGGAVDARADLYAVGLLLFEMIVGESPFEGCDSKDVFMAHILKPAPALSERLPGAPSELNHLVARLLEKKPDDRPNSARGVARALRAVARTAFGGAGEVNTVSEPLSGALTPLAEAAPVPSPQRGGSARVRVDAGVSPLGPTQSRTSHPAPRSRGPASSRTAALAQLDAGLPPTRTSAPAPKTPPPVSNSTPPWHVPEPTPAAGSSAMTRVAVVAGVVGAVLSIGAVWAFAPRAEEGAGVTETTQGQGGDVAEVGPTPEPLRAAESGVPAVEERVGRGSEPPTERSVSPSQRPEPAGATLPVASPRIIQSPAEPAPSEQAELRTPDPDVDRRTDESSETELAVAVPSEPEQQLPAPQATVPPVSDPPPEEASEPPRRLPGSGIPGF